MDGSISSVQCSPLVQRCNALPAAGCRCQATDPVQACRQELQLSTLRPRKARQGSTVGGRAEARQREPRPLARDRRCMHGGNCWRDSRGRGSMCPSDPPATCCVRHHRAGGRTSGRRPGSLPAHPDAPGVSRPAARRMGAVRRRHVTYVLYARGSGHGLCWRAASARSSAALASMRSMLLLLR